MPGSAISADDPYQLREATELRPSGDSRLSLPSCRRRYPSDRDEYHRSAAGESGRAADYPPACPGPARPGQNSTDASICRLLLVKMVRLKCTSAVSRASLWTLASGGWTRFRWAPNSPYSGSSAWKGRESGARESEASVGRSIRFVPRDVLKLQQKVCRANGAVVEESFKVASHAAACRVWVLGLNQT